MIRRPGIVAGAVLTAAVLASCGWSAPTIPDGSAPAVPSDPAAGYLPTIVSVCDEWGNRVYFRPTVQQALAVVGADPTCSAVGSGLGNGGQESGGPSVDLEGAVTG